MIGKAPILSIGVIKITKEPLLAVDNRKMGEKEEAFSDIIGYKLSEPIIFRIVAPSEGEIPAKSLKSGDLIEVEIVKLEEVRNGGRG